MTIHTVGHGTLARDEFATLVGEAGITEVIDIRSFPGSRHNPQFGRDEMARWLPAAGIAYSWMPSLGGRRKQVPGSAHVALRHPSFQAYADYMETQPFLAGVDELLARGDGRTVMCSETLWWRCHRRLLADHLVLVRDIEVLHLMHDGRRTPHDPTRGVRVEGHRLVYDVGATPPLLEYSSHLDRHEGVGGDRRRLPMTGVRRSGLGRRLRRWSDGARRCG